MLKINLQNIDYFLKVAETLNFTAAAKALYVSQPALSKQIRQLEKDVDVQLLKRNTKGVELTEGGRIMYRAWSDILRRTEDALEEARKANVAGREKVRVGLLEMGGVIDVMMPLLERFTQEQPDMDLEFATYGFIELKEKLKKHELDMIFSFSSEIPSNRAGISFQILKDLELNIIVSRKNRLYLRDFVTVQDLKNETMYVLGNSYSDEAKRSILEHCKREGVYPVKLKTFPNITSLAVGLSTGDGVSIGYHVFYNNMEDKVKFFPIENEIGKHFIVVAWDNHKKQETEGLIEYLLEKLKGRG